jgi:ribosome biogenesis GTPase
VQAADRDFNINRLERYLTICNTSGVKPVIVLSKTDLIDESALNTIVESIKARITHVPVLAISNETRNGYETVNAIIEMGKTYCLLGSSGVGKSSLVNNLSGKTLMRTDAISLNTHKGRHVTTNRELVVLENGGILIDNPGMREVGIADAGSGLEITFDLIFQLSRDCKFMDCTHTNEIGCAVLKAVENGDIDSASYENYRKLEREKAHFEATIAEKRKREKEFGKIMKNYKKDILRNEQ